MFAEWAKLDWSRRGPRDVALVAAQWGQLVSPEPSRVLLILRATAGMELSDSNRGTAATGMFTHPIQAGSANNSFLPWTLFGDFIRGQIFGRAAAGLTVTVTEFFIPSLAATSQAAAVKNIGRMADLVDALSRRCEDGQRQSLPYRPGR